ncbi:hypothetical protein Sste5344_006830 [Sporothrix stenoceras]
MDLDTKQTDGSVHDNKSTGDNQTATPVTPVTPKSSILPDVSLMTPPKSSPPKQSSQNQNQRRRSIVTSPCVSNPFSLFSSPFSPLASLSTLRSLEHIQAENQYLSNELHRLDVRIRSLLGALGAVQAQLQRQENATQAGQDPLPFTTAEARKLRKSAGFIQSKIASTERQEKLIVVRIGEVMAEMQGRQWLAQLQQQRYQRRVSAAGGGSGPVSPAFGVAVVPIPIGDGYFPLQVPQTPYLAPCDVWTPDQLHFTQQFILPFSQQQHVQQHEQHPTTTTNLVLPQSFVVSPVTPGLHATMPASPVSPPASVSGGGSSHNRNNSCMSPMSPLAPIFEPGPSSSFFPFEGEHGDSTATPVACRSSSSAAHAALDHVGMHYAYENAVAIGDGEDDDDGEGLKQNYTHEGYSRVNVNVNDNGNETGDSDVSDTAFLPPEARPRRVSHSAARPTQNKQKRMSLPPVRFAWAEEGQLE